MHRSTCKEDTDWRKELEEEARLMPEEIKKAEADRREEEEIMRDLQELEWEQEMARMMREYRLRRTSEVALLDGEEFRQSMINALEPFDLD